MIFVADWVEADVVLREAEVSWNVQLVSWDDSKTKKVGHMKAFAFNKWAYLIEGKSLE